jgi:hypothetical protein
MQCTGLSGSERIVQIGYCRCGGVGCVHYILGHVEADDDQELVQVADRVEARAHELVLLHRNAHLREARHDLVRV